MDSSSFELKSFHFRCDSSTFSKLVIPYLGGVYVASLTVHSCSTVFVANDSFSGVILSDRLEFSNIGRLTFEPYAFRNLLKSPKQLVIDKCSLPVVLPYTFTGLSHMEHFWFRNSTIHQLHTHAFYHLRHVNYLYFRDVTFHRIEQRAFGKCFFAGKMYSINHLFMGGTIRVNSSDRWLLAASFVDEVVLEGVTGDIDESFIYDTNIRVVIVRDSTLSLRSRDAMVTTSDETIQEQMKHYGAELHIINVNMNALTSALLRYFNRITISNCSIQNISPSTRSFTTSVHSNLIVTISNTTIHSIDSYALANLSVFEFQFWKCRVKSLKRFAISGGRFERVRIEATRITSFDETIFADSYMNSLRITNVDITKIQQMAFHRSTIRKLEIVDTRIDILEKLAFSGSQIHALSLRRTTINNIEDNPFEHAEIIEVQIVGCHLAGIQARQLFSKLTPVRLQVINSSIDCDPNDCEANSMLLKSPRHELHWNFKGNSCRISNDLKNQHSTICTKPIIFRHSGITCRLSWMIADCVCSDTLSSVKLSAINTTVIIIGDCEHLSITETNSAKALYLFRIYRCDLVRVGEMLKALTIYHSNVVVYETAIRNTHLSIIYLLYTNILKIAQNALYNVNIDELIVKNSIMNWHPLAFIESRIQQADIIESKIATITPLVQIVTDLRITNSILMNAESLSTMENLSLNNNTILCCCDDARGYCRANKTDLQNCAIHFGRFVCGESNQKNNMSYLYTSFIISLIFVII
ncbi:hypothetical protein DICVIV_08075 [Dictyocaulus viviparus]|uniref:Leucine Rich repeat-containing domain protein n=1 Tax=Dictyocaulus viviparus TaxID=29172 RepID=A0A0D8XU30_DICVI|nr:hypothetical protein DICVIV_08075 [Dictyocaulus viviparus]